MKILIIGKNGQVGSSLVEEVKANHIDYCAVGRPELDITNENAVKDYFAKHNDFNFVVNAAAYTNVDGAEKESELSRNVNYFAVKYLAEACKKYNIPLIHISTDYIFDGEKVTGYDENDIPNPKNIYGLTKLEGEEVLKNTWEKYIILRVSWVFSEFGKNFVKTIAKASDTRSSLSVVCDQFGSPTSAKSIAETIIHICKKTHAEKNVKSHWGVYHFCDFPVTNWQQFAKHVVCVRHPDKNIPVVAIESKDYATVAQRPKNSILNTQKIKNTFNIDQKCWMTEVNRIIKII